MRVHYKVTCTRWDAECKAWREYQITVSGSKFQELTKHGVEAIAKKQMPKDDCYIRSEKMVYQ